LICWAVCDIAGDRTHQERKARRLRSRMLQKWDPWAPDVLHRSKPAPTTSGGVSTSRPTSLRADPPATPAVGRGLPLRQPLAPACFGTRLCYRRSSRLALNRAMRRLWNPVMRMGFVGGCCAISAARSRAAITTCLARSSLVLVSRIILALADFFMTAP
jgi:hypothetical protein